MQYAINMIRAILLGFLAALLFASLPNASAETRPFSFSGDAVSSAVTDSQ